MPTTVFEEAKSVFFSMNESGASEERGGCTQDWWDAAVEDVGAAAAMAKLMNVSTGAAILSMSGVTYTADGGHLTKAGIHVGVEVGMVAFIKGDEVEEGRYRISAVNTDDVQCNGLDGDDCMVEFRVGGATDELQVILDETDATDYSVTIYIQSTPTLEAQIDFDFGGGSNTNNTFKRIVGFNTAPGDMSYGGEYYESPAEILRNGSIDSNKTVVIDGDDGSFDILNVAVDNVIFENIHLYNSVGQHVIAFDSVPMNIVFRNCRFSDAVGAFSDGVENVLFDSCYSHDDLTGSQYVPVAGKKNIFLNCVLKLPAGLTGIVGHSSSSGTCVIGCIIVGGSQGVRPLTAGSTMLVMNNTFYNQTTFGVYVNAGDDAVVFNNIFMLATGAVGIQLNGASSCSYNDYNCFIEADGTPLTVGGHGSGYEAPVKGAHSVEVDPDFVDAANGDFRARNPLLLRGGRPGPDGRAAVIGAIGQEYQFAARARMMNQGRAGIIK